MCIKKSLGPQLETHVETKRENGMAKRGAQIKVLKPEREGS